MAALSHQHLFSVTDVDALLRSVGRTALEVVELSVGCSITLFILQSVSAAKIARTKQSAKLLRRFSADLLWMRISTDVRLYASLFFRRQR